jgi:hypothetical protein
VLRVLKPLGIEAAVKAIEAHSSETTAAHSPCSRHAMRPLMPAGSTMLSIRPIGSSPASWSATGTRRCSLSRRLKERS